MMQPPQHPREPSSSSSPPFITSAPFAPASVPVLRPRLVPRFFGFFFISSSLEVGANERTDTWTTVDSGGSGRFRDVRDVSSVRMRPRYSIRRNAALGGSSSDQSLGHVLHTISLSSPMLVFGSNSTVRRRPETSSRVMETFGVFGIGVGSMSGAGAGTSESMGSCEEGTASAMSSCVAGGGG